MGKSYAGRHQANARQLPAYSDQGRHKKFDLMPIQVSADADIVERYANISAIDIFQGYTFIDDRAVSRRSLQSLTQYFRGGGDIIEQSDLSKIRC